MSDRKIMSLQGQYLNDCVEGYKLTDVPLVGQNINICHVGDEPGMYYFVSKIVKYFNIPIDSAVDLFYGSITVAFLCLAIVGFFILFRSWVVRIFAILGMIMIYLISSKFLYYYSIAPLITFATIPILLFFEKKQKDDWLFYVFLIVSGLLFALGNSIRIHSGTGSLLFFIVAVLFLFKRSWTQKAKLITYIIVSFLSVNIFFLNIEKNRDNYISKHTPQEQSMDVSSGHIKYIWHSIYIGFGFLKYDKLNIDYNDQCAMDKVESVDPNILFASKKYCEILRQEVFKILMNYPFFAIRTVFAKIGVILFYILLFANIGLITTLYYPKPASFHWSFITAIFFNALFGVLTLPTIYYSLGVIAVSFLYGIININYAYEQKWYKKEKEKVVIGK